MAETFEAMLSGGHPNSLGRTEEVVDRVLRSPHEFDALFNTYDSEDEVVRLRVSSALKRVFLARPEWFGQSYTRFSKRVTRLGQPSALWTLALLCLRLEDELTVKQRRDAMKRLQETLDTCNDWIVINNTLETLAHWAKKNPGLASWLVPRAQALSKDRRKSVAKRAQRALAALC